MWLAAPALASPAALTRAAALGVLVAAGLVLYAVFCQLAGVIDFRRLVRRRG
jgi:putative peptidoglycan lipid II flippase